MSARSPLHAVAELLRATGREVLAVRGYPGVMIRDPQDDAWTIYYADRHCVAYADVDGVGGQILNLPTGASPQLIAAVVIALNTLEGP